MAARPAESLRQTVTSPVARAACGLLARTKSLPSWLFYDAEGSRLYERITQLPEYYPWRAEREIFAEQADAIVERAGGVRLHPLELGAGGFEKSQLILEALVRRQGPTRFVPVDVSASALAAGQSRLERELPAVKVMPLVGHHEDAFSKIRAGTLVMFIGSSIGNYEEPDARRLLAGVRRAGAVLLLGTDLVKDPAILVPAYDDAEGVTAAFNKNVLARLNRELGAEFDLDTFRHVALWNAAASRIEMHLESLVEQKVAVPPLGRPLRFRQGERIHTESSIKYDLARVDRLLADSGWRREASYHDRRRWFAVHLARA